MTGFVWGIIAAVAVVGAVFGVRRWWRWLQVHRQAPHWAEEYEMHGDDRPV